MKTVWITGADRGIGFALCKEFLLNGYQVFAGRFMPEWPELTKLQDESHGSLICIPLDVGSTESVKAAAKKTAELCDTIDILINCAGIVSGDGEENFYRTVNVNAVGALRMAECFLPLMKTGMRRLCFFSSEAGSISLLHRDSGYAYCVSKAVLNMEVKRMFQKLQPEGYTFRLYHPGWVRTYMSGQKSTEGNFEAADTAAVAYRQFTEAREQENVLMMTDVKGEVWPF